MQFYHHLFNIILFSFATGLGTAYLITRRPNPLSFGICILTVATFNITIYLVQTVPSPP